MKLNLMSCLLEMYHPIRKNDPSKLDNTSIRLLSTTVVKLAKDKSIRIINPLDLVHKTYAECQIQRPTPSMRGAWDQYEDMIVVAVKNFHKFRQ